MYIIELEFYLKVSKPGNIAILGH